MRKKTTADLAPRPEGASKSRETLLTPIVAARKTLGPFERYLSVWVGACMVVGVLLGKLLPALIDGLRRLEFGAGSQINLPIAVLIWLMIYPMMMKVDFAAIRDVGKRPRGLLVTLFVNWLVKPFSMALIAWLFFRTSSRPGSPRRERTSTSPAPSSWPRRPARPWSSSGAISPTAIPAYTLVQVSRQRPDHAGSLRADRAVSRQRRLVARGPVPGAARTRSASSS